MIKERILKNLQLIIKKNFLIALQLYIFKIGFKFKRKIPAKNIKISFVNTHDQSGGAAKIAYSLALSMKEKHPINFFVLEKKKEDNWISKIPQNDYPFWQELFRREAKVGGWIEFSGFRALFLLNNYFYNSSTIVHLHNLHGEFFSPALFSNLFRKKKIVWTLHDESIITGHCSCTLGCERWKKGCGNCPDLSVYPAVEYDNTSMVLAMKKKWILEVQPIVVSPSSWLAERVRTAYPRLDQIKVIPNGIDTSVFTPRNKGEMRIKLGLPIDAKIILFVAEYSTNNPFKGGNIIRDLISDIDLEKYTFVTVGGDSVNKFKNLIPFSYVKDEKVLNHLYAACDIMLYPTQADNLPLVVLESMASGTPVIASNLGGIPEIITDKKYGFLIDEYKVTYSFKKVLMNYFELSEENRQLMQLSVRERVVSSFSLQMMVEKYQELYLK